MTDDRIVFGKSEGDVDMGTHPATLAGIEKKTSETGDFRVWTFTLGSGATVSGSSSLSMHPKSKSANWAVALLGRTPSPGEDVTELLTGRPCLVSVMPDKNDWPKVVAVMAAPSSGKTQAKPAEPVNDLDDLPF